MTDDQFKAQVTKKHYVGTVYDSKARFCSYWHQIDETLRMKPVNVLEVGMGSGLVHERLKYYGLDARTLDIAADLKPDIQGSVTDIPVEGGSFDVIICCQVLEHLPYSQFPIALKELRRVAKKGCILSLPDVTAVNRYECPVFGGKRGFVSVNAQPKPHVFNGEHYWEIGKSETLIQQVTIDIETAWEINREYRVFENPYHHFFILV